MAESYLALIGDIIDSRHLNDRESVQKKLEAVLDQINIHYSDSIKAKFLITIGDEFQGLLLPTSEAYMITITILEQMHPVKIRFGLGYGGISTSLKETAIGMDGTAFYAARQALEQLKNSKEAAIRLSGPTLAETNLRAANAMLSSLSVIRQFWAENFKTVLPLLRQGLTQQEVANATDITQSAVSWMLHRAKWRDVQAIEKEFIAWLGLTF